MDTAINSLSLVIILFIPTLTMFSKFGIIQDENYQ